MKMRPFGRLISPEAARRRLLSATTPIARVERVPLAAAVGRVASRTVRAPVAVPAFARATWDGYALHSQSTATADRTHPVRLKVVGEIFAEEELAHPLRPGEAAAIATGGALPRGADAVVIFESVQLDDGEIVLSRPVRRGDRIAHPGEDFRRGDRLVDRGAPLTPAALGAVGSVGRTSIEVYSRPRVALVPNGNELMAPGTRPAPRRIYETNNLTLGALVEAAGAIAEPFAPVRDDPTQIERALRRALRRSDLVLVTGGSSVGEHDFLPQVLPRLGRLLFHGIAVRPGKPTLAVLAGTKLIVGMPGHPTSCLSNGFWLLLPVLRKLAHLPGPGWTEGTVRLTEPYSAPESSFSTVVPFHVERGEARPTFHDSSAITSLAGANAFLLAPPGKSSWRTGEIVTVKFLAPPIGAPALS